MSTFADDIAAGKHDGKMRAAVVSAFNAGQSATHAIALWAAGEAQRETAERCAQIAGSVPYIRDWDGYTVDDSAYAIRSDILIGIHAEFLTTEKEN
jgi:hypothetical protein